MAKAPRRRGRGSGDEGGSERRSSKRAPRSRKPAQPPVAKPVKPVAKPVQPVAKPGKSAARSKKPAAAKPVAKPVARPGGGSPRKSEPKSAGKAAAKSKGRATRSRMAEEDIGGARGRGAARKSSASGMSMGAKVGLVAGLVAFVCIGLTVLMMSAGKDDAQADYDAFGFEAASALAVPDAKWWRTAGASGGRGMGYIRKKVGEILGEGGKEWWDERVELLSQPIPRDMEGTFEGEKLGKDKKRFEQAVAKESRGSGGGGSKNVPQNRIVHAWNAMDANPGGRYRLEGAWVREPGAEGAWLGGAGVQLSDIEPDPDAPSSFGNGGGAVNGRLAGVPVRMFSARIRGVGTNKPLVGFVAVSDSGSDNKGLALGMLMLLVGSIAVALAAYAVANGHAKHVQALAREVDRLGSAGDPTRSLHAHGAEASALARSVERMVSNLEFRDKHDGADLEEVVDREQQVAEEIHGSLMSKNPPRLSDYEVETLFKPGFEIGGDHFEYFRIDDDHLGILLLDTNVRGIPAALVMASARAYVRAEAPGVLSPAELLKRVNRHLAGQLPAGRHVTGLYVVLNQSDGSATLASAGHLPLLVYRHQTGKMAKVNPEGIALGLDAGPVFDDSLQEGDIPIGVGDRIVLYTDGALKIQDETGDEFGESRFYGAVANEAPKNSQAFVNFVGAAIDRFHLEVPQNDDITISTIKRLR